MNEERPLSPIRSDGGDPWKTLQELARAEQARASTNAAESGETPDTFSQRVVSRWLRESEAPDDQIAAAEKTHSDPGASLWEALGLRGLAAAAALAAVVSIWCVAALSPLEAATSEIASVDLVSVLFADR